MRTSVTLLQRFQQPHPYPSILFLLTLGLTITCSHGVRAQSSDTAPSQLKNTLAQIDAAASNHQVQTVMQFYSPNFSSSDGLTRQQVQGSLTQLWQRYPNLSYHTELTSWQGSDNDIVAETVTHITGNELVGGRNMKMDSTLRSRQRMSSGKIVQQQILAERTQLTSGAHPPTVDLNIPLQVHTGQEYDFDAIVKEPLGDDLLLGAAVEEPVRAQAYLKPSSYELQPLNAGGIFKVGQAPTKEGNYWLSAVLIRQDGMTVVTQRLQVVN